MSSVRLIAWGIVLASAAAAGCVGRQPASFDSPIPNKRLDAIVDAAGTDDPTTLARLVEQLESPEPASRMFAIRALERSTGQTLGYRYSDPWPKRTEAVNRWKVFLEEGTTGRADRSVDPEARRDDHVPVDDQEVG